MSDSTEKKPEPKPFGEILPDGSSRVPIKYKNGKEELKVFPELDVEQREEFTNLLCEGRTSAIVRLCTRMNKEWINALDYGCYLKLAKHFIIANFPYALLLATHDPVTGLKVDPVWDAMMRLLPSEALAISATMPGAGQPPTTSSPSEPAPAGSAAAT